MCVREAGCHLDDDGPGSGSRQRHGIQLLDHAAQQLSLQELHGEELGVVIPIELVDLDDVGVRQGLRAVKFPPQIR
jgi:hypothetical protein